MTIVSITKPAKCKDCKFIQSVWFGVKKNQKRHKCINPESPRYGHEFSTIKPFDFVCEKWKL